MNQLMSDLRYALRGMRNAPGFTAITVLTLAIGIGASAAIFTVVNGVLLSPLPYAESDRLVSVWSRFLPESGYDFPQFALSPPEYWDYRRSNRSMESVAALSYAGLTLTGDDAVAEQVSGAAVSASLLDVLRVTPLRGRNLTEEEEVSGARVVMLGHGLWQRRFGGTDLVGRTIQINRNAYDVIAILPPDFAYPSPDVQLMVPLGLDSTVLTDLSYRASHFLTAVGRLRDGVTLEQASAEMRTMMESWRAQYPELHTGHFLYLSRRIDDIVGDIRPTLVLLLAAVGFVLLIVCANAANLLMARGEARRQEMTVRTALGAGRRRLVRQLLTESAVLAVVGGALGLAIAAATVPALVSIGGASIPRAAEITMRWPVLLFSLGATMFATVLFGLVPAFEVGRGDAAQAFREVARSVTASSRRLMLRNVLIVAEVAISVLVVVGAILVTRSFQRLQSVDVGFEPGQVVTARIGLPAATYDSTRAQLFFDELTSRVAALPGVAGVSAARALPLADGWPEQNFLIDGREEPGPGQQAWNAGVSFVREDYFAVMQTPILEGREFTAADRAGAETVAVVNREFARRFWGDRSPIGDRITFTSSSPLPWARIVGVVENTRRVSLREEPRPTYYFAHRQSEDFLLANRALTLVVRTAIPAPTRVISGIRDQLSAIDPDVPFSYARTYEDVLGDDVAQPRFLMLLMLLFALVALAVATAGIYGVTSFGVAQRAREIGIRMALGARRGQVIRMVMAQTVAVVGIGMGIGLVAAIGASDLLRNLVYEVSVVDPITYAAVSLLLLGVAMTACLVPALRAARIDPIHSLRH